MQIKVIDSRRYRRIYEEVMKKLDKLENEFLPQVTIDTTEIIFGPIKFLQAQTKYLTIANTGQVSFDLFLCHSKIWNNISIFFVICFYHQRGYSLNINVDVLLFLSYIVFRITGEIHFTKGRDDCQIREENI